MKTTGGCYCKAVRYEIDGDPMFKGQCHCRECQQIAGGQPSVFMVMAPTALKYTKGAPKSFTRTDIPNAVTREFCENCGTQLVTRAQGGAMLIVKVGGLDDPSVFEGPQMIMYTSEKLPFHTMPPGVPTFEKFPG